MRGPAFTSTQGTGVSTTKAARVEVLLGIVLVCVLGIYGDLLSRQMSRIQALHQAQRVAVASIALENESLAFAPESGFDVSGKQIAPVLPQWSKETMVFMLRAASLGADLNYWQTVERLIPKRVPPLVSLVGYCDGQKCIDLVRRDLKPPDFPVIAYGEATSSQALFNADAAGDFFLFFEQSHQVKRLQWRAANETPLSLVQEINLW